MYENIGETPCLDERPTWRLCRFEISFQLLNFRDGGEIQGCDNWKEMAEYVNGLSNFDLIGA